VEELSKDWGGQVNDYLSAIDDISKESYVDNARLGVGASYGGYCFIWPEYITIVLNVHCSRWRFQHAEHVWYRRSILQQLGFCGLLGEGQCYSAKPIPHSTLLI
jgi:hypothetical protein